MFMSNLIGENQSLARIVQTADWVTHHPIISLVVVLLSLAVIASIIKAIIRLIETASWSILKFPLQLLAAILKFILLSLMETIGLVFKQIKSSPSESDVITITDVQTVPSYEAKQKRLSEISQRLATIQQEQQLLLKEIAELIDKDSN